MFAFPLVQLTNYFHNIAQLDSLFFVFLAFTPLSLVDFCGKNLHLLPLKDIWLAVFGSFKCNCFKMFQIFLWIDKKGKLMMKCLKLVMGEVSGDGNFSSMLNMCKHIAVNYIISRRQALNTENFSFNVESLRLSTLRLKSFFSESFRMIQRLLKSVLLPGGGWWSLSLLIFRIFSRNTSLRLHREFPLTNLRAFTRIQTFLEIVFDHLQLIIAVDKINKPIQPKNETWNLLQQKQTGTRNSFFMP